MEGRFTHKVIIIGGGPAGFTAAIYSARGGLKPLVIQGPQPGGQLMITTDVENYPGFSRIQGPELMEAMEKQALHVGATLIEDTVTRVDFSKRPLICYGSKGVYQSHSVILATGAYAKWLGIPGEKEWQGRGVSACATCDGFFFKNKVVAVVGGGNTATEEALFLSNLAKKVILIHRRDSLKSEKILQKRLREKENISFIWDTQVTQCLEAPGQRRLGALKLLHRKTQEERELPVDGVFVAIGHAPNTQSFKGQLEMDEFGYIRCAPGSTRTSVSGVFAAGDVQDSVYRQAVTAAGQGCMAALDAERYLQESSLI